MWLISSKQLSFLLLFVFVSPNSLHAEAAVLEVTCEAGGEFGNIVMLKISRDYKFGKLTVKRSAANSDYVRDLTEFKGGNYRLDLNPRGGITGYSLEYGAIDSDQLQTSSASITCPDASPTTVATPPVTPPAKKPTAEAAPMPSESLAPSKPQDDTLDLTELD